LKKEKTMSKYIEISVKLRPAYGTGGLSAVFPKLSKFLKDYGYSSVLEDEPSLYQLVDALVMVRKDPAIAEQAKSAVVRMESQMTKVRDEARELLLSRKLNELDSVLYRLEDLFKDLEKELL
jgi:hypothetical protein